MPSLHFAVAPTGLVFDDTVGAVRAAFGAEAGGAAIGGATFGFATDGGVVGAVAGVDDDVFATGAGAGAAAGLDIDFAIGVGAAAVGAGVAVDFARLPAVDDFAVGAAPVQSATPPCPRQAPLLLVADVVVPSLQWPLMTA